jgi:hypothetical protein
MYLKDFGDEPSWGNLHFSTNLQMMAGNFSLTSKEIAVFVNLKS